VRLVAPLLLVLGLPAGAALVPLSQVVPPSTGRAEVPLSLGQAEQWLEDLQQNPVVAPESLRPFEERLASLEKAPSQSWYDESHLEAGEALRDQLAAETRGLATDLDAAASAIESRGLEGAGDQEARALAAALKGLDSRTLALDPALLQRLKDAGTKRRLAPLDGASLARRLREGAGFCRATLRECRAGEPGCIEVAARRAGRGGVKRGPGPAPLTLDPEAELRVALRLEGVSSDDLRNAALGETIGTSLGRPSVDRGRLRETRGGAAVAGKGGDVVGRSVLTPDERRVLQSYFAE
jgi:hypothetical protein